MIFTPTHLPGGFIIDPEPIADERGFFARMYTPEEFEAKGLNPRIAQTSLSYNRAKGTLRGMHYQVEPHAEVKLVRCTAGAIFDVMIDLRPDSPTFKKWAGVELSAKNRRMLYIPEGMAHGFITLEDDSDVSYQLSAAYSPQHARGVRYNDPAFGIEWPIEVSCIAARDRDYPDFRG